MKTVSFSVAPGESYGLVGESGSGKSTILRALAGLNPFWSGHMAIAGQKLTAKRPRALRRLVLVREAATDEGVPREPSPFWHDVRALFDPADVGRVTQRRALSSLTWPLAAGALGPAPKEPWTWPGTAWVDRGGAGVAVGVPPPPPTVTVTPAPGASRLPLSSAARVLMVTDPDPLGVQL